MRVAIIIKSFIDALLGKIFPGRKVPFSMYWIITERCTNNCRYCNYKNTASSAELKAQELPTEQVKKMLKEMAGAGCRKIQFAGGEPLLRDDISEILKQAKDCGMYVGLSTSGVGLKKHPDIYKYLDIAFISLDGPPEVHNWTRNGNFFEHAVSAVKFFKEKGVNVFTTAVLSKLNVNSLDFLSKFASDNNLLYNFTPLNIQENVKDIHIPSSAQIKDFLLTPEEMRDALRCIKTKKAAGHPIGSSSAYLQYLIDWDDYSIHYKTEKHKGLDCYAGKFFAYLFPNGGLYACGDLYWREKPQNAVEKGFKKAFVDLPKPKCQACMNACYVEQNLVYSLNWRSVFEWGRERVWSKW